MMFAWVASGSTCDSTLPSSELSSSPGSSSAASCSTRGEVTSALVVASWRVVDSASVSMPAADGSNTSWVEAW